jgi:predicted  nucleic acid-binding Zn-ribbon protein
MMVLRQENQELMAENRRFKDRIAVLEPQLKQAKKELNEANDLLIEMRIELNNWKADILGFRNEIRNADKAQLKALLRILEVLGGEVKLASNKAEETDVSEE